MKTIFLTISMLFIASVAALSQGFDVQCEDTCSHIHGIDISHYQGEVFWDAVGDNAKMAYVYLKATEGGTTIDDMYEMNIRLAHQNGLKVGSYHFFRAATPLREQLINFKTQCRASEQDLIPMIDIESKGKLSTEQFCDSVILFLEMIEQSYGQKPLVYTGVNFYNRYLSGILDDYPLMIAIYREGEEPELEDGHDIMIWQYTAKGRIDGISGYVDKSRFMGGHSMREIRFRRHR